jgi:putative endonuclease
MFDLFGFLRRRAAPGTPRQETGRAAEQAAARFLKKHGYRVVARNIAYRQGEVDLVALERASGTLCFVEVRSRAVGTGEVPHVTPEEGVTPAKRQRVVRAAKRFALQRRTMERPMRFDVIAVRFTGDDRRHPDIRHYPAAFDAAGHLT